MWWIGETIVANGSESYSLASAEAAEITYVAMGRRAVTSVG